MTSAHTSVIVVSRRRVAAAIDKKVEENMVGLGNHYHCQENDFDKQLMFLCFSLSTNVSTSVICVSFAMSVFLLFLPSFVLLGMESVALCCKL